MTRQRKGVRPARPDFDEPSQRPHVPVQVQETGALLLPPSITVGELAQVLKVNPADIINPLIRSGVFATMNQGIDRETASLIARSGVDFFAHRTGFTRKSLSAAVARAGFGDQYCSQGNLELNLIAFKGEADAQKRALFGLPG